MGRHSETKPMPSDFPIYAADETHAQLKKRYNVGTHVLQRWHMENGGNPRVRVTMRPVPDDFHQLAPVNSINFLHRHYVADERVIKRWLRETGLEPATVYIKRPDKRIAMPEEFAEVAPGMTQRELAKRYKCARDVIRQWLEIAGIASKGRNQRKPRSEYTKSAPRRTFEFRGHAGLLVLRDMRSRSIYDEAADLLRRHDFRINRCDERGRYDANGSFWRSGNTLLTPDELLQRADKYRKRAA